MIDQSVLHTEIDFLKSRLPAGNEDFSRWNLSQKLLQQSDETQSFFNRLKDEYRRLSPIVSQANRRAREKKEGGNYKILLQISPNYFKPSERKIEDCCEFVVQAPQVNEPHPTWTVEEFQSKIEQSENNECNQLIGVGNIFLKALFYHTKLDYTVPIIKSTGQVSGSLHVILDQTGLLSMKKCDDFHMNSTIAGSVSQNLSFDTDGRSLAIPSPSENSLEDEGIGETTSFSTERNNQITIKFSIKEIRDLPLSTADHIVCRYTFINPKLDQIVSMENSRKEISDVLTFNHETEYTFRITDHFLQTCSQGSLSIEVWYQWNSIPRTIPLKIQMLEWSRPWRDVKRYLQFSVEIQELNAAGQWTTVDVDQHDGIVSGGIYRLKQGQSKRVFIELKVMPQPSTMPFVVETIRSIEIGSINARKLEAPIQLDSYQEDQLKYLKDRWTQSIEQRKETIVKQMNLSNADPERENDLLDQLLKLAEEHNIAECPPVGSGLPGAPVGWKPPPAIEMHRPMIFLNVDSDPIAGRNATLIEEVDKTMIKLPLIQMQSDEMIYIGQWNPSSHDSAIINELTPSDVVVYLILKITLIISQPIRMELVLRKRLAVTIGKGDGWWNGKTLKNWLGHKAYKRTSVVYEVISHIPDYQCAQLGLNDDRILFEEMTKHLHYGSMIDSLLLLDRLRQEVLLMENCAKQQRTMRKSISAPMMNHQQLVDHFSSERNETCWQHQSRSPSLQSRRSFLEQEQVEPIQRSQMRLRDSINLEEQDNRSTSLNEDEEEEQEENCSYSIDDRVIVNTGHSVCNKLGYIRFIGRIHIKSGRWFGIELDERLGKNNGTLDGHVYFQCSDQHGIFVRAEKIRHLEKTIEEKKVVVLSDENHYDD